MASSHWRLLPQHQLENKLFGLITRAITRSGIQCRSDLQNNLTDTLRRLLQRTQAGRQYVVCLPTVDQRARVKQRDAIRSSRTIQRHLARLQDLGLIKLIHHARCTVVRFVFRICRFAVDSEDRQVSALSVPQGGEPSRVPPPVKEKPPAGAALPQLAPPSAGLLTDIAALREGCTGGRSDQQPEDPGMKQARAKARQIIEAGPLKTKYHQRSKVPEKISTCSGFNRKINIIKAENFAKWVKQTCLPACSGHARRTAENIEDHVT